MSSGSCRGEIPQCVGTRRDASSWKQVRAEDRSCSCCRRAAGDHGETGEGTTTMTVLQNSCSSREEKGEARGRNWEASQVDSTGR